MIDVIETQPNPKGICAVNASKDICVLACPGKSVGAVHIVHFDKNSMVIDLDKSH